MPIFSPQLPTAQLDINLPDHNKNILGYTGLLFDFLFCDIFFHVAM
jgi:hypothetical protein